MIAVGAFRGRCTAAAADIATVGINPAPPRWLSTRSECPPGSRRQTTYATSTCCCLPSCPKEDARRRVSLAGLARAALALPPAGRLHLRPSMNEERGGHGSRAGATLLPGWRTGWAIGDPFDASGNVVAPGAGISPGRSLVDHRRRRHRLVLTGRPRPVGSLLWKAPVLWRGSPELVAVGLVALSWSGRWATTVRTLAPILLTAVGVVHRRSNRAAVTEAIPEELPGIRLPPRPPPACPGRRCSRLCRAGR